MVRNSLIYLNLLSYGTTWTVFDRLIGCIALQFCAMDKWKIQVPQRYKPWNTNLLVNPTVASFLVTGRIDEIIRGTERIAVRANLIL